VVHRGVIEQGRPQTEDEALNKEIDKTEIDKFLRVGDMPGCSPTQGDLPAAVPFVGHALLGMQRGTMRRAVFAAKGSLILDRMSQLSDGMSFVLEAHFGLSGRNVVVTRIW
jgi:glycine/sarcosine/betaine reductase complex component C subunit beta